MLNKTIEDLILDNLDHTDMVSNVIIRKFSRNNILSKEDFIQAGRRGLVEAAKNWNPKKSKGVFKSYLEFRIRGSIIEELRRIEKGRHNKLYKSDIETNVLEQLTPYLEDKSLDLLKYVIEKNLISNLVNKVKLNNREKLILREYYWKDITMEEIGKKIHIHASRVSQIHTKIIMKMKAASA